MYIKKVVLEEVSFPLFKPFKTALREATHTKSLYVKIICTNGIIGYGECTETIAITGEFLSSQKYIIEEVFIPQLENKNLLEYESVLNLLNVLAPNNYSAKAAVDCAIYDCVSQFYQIPIYQLLGGSKKQFLTSVTVSLNPIEEMIKQANEFVNQGFKLLKLKLGNDIQLDIERFLQLVDCLPEDTLFRIDANQGWNLKEAWRFMEKTHLVHDKIQFIEQPVHRNKLLDLKQLKEQTPLLIVADESVFDVKDARRVLEMRAADVINIKLMKCGGISQAMKIANLSSAYQVPCMIGCMLETELAITSALQVAMSNSNIHYVDLDAPLLINRLINRTEYIEGRVFLK